MRHARRYPVWPTPARNGRAGPTHRAHAMTRAADAAIVPGHAAHSPTLLSKKTGRGDAAPGTVVASKRQKKQHTPQSQAAERPPENHITPEHCTMVSTELSFV